MVYVHVSIYEWSMFMCPSYEWSEWSMFMCPCYEWSMFMCPSYEWSRCSCFHPMSGLNVHVWPGLYLRVGGEGHLPPPLVSFSPLASIGCSTSHKPPPPLFCSYPKFAPPPLGKISAYSHGGRLYIYRYYIQWDGTRLAYLQRMQLLIEALIL